MYVQSAFSVLVAFRNVVTNVLAHFMFKLAGKFHLGAVELLENGLSSRERILYEVLRGTLILVPLVVQFLSLL